jgi:PiT family inorganic phosphate transporter
VIEAGLCAACVLLALATGANYAGKALGLHLATGRASPAQARCQAGFGLAAGALLSLVAGSALLATFGSLAPDFSAHDAASAAQLAVNPGFQAPQVRVLVAAAAAMAAAAWTLCASWRGWPSSSTHAIGGGLWGAAWAAGFPPATAALLALLLPLACAPLAGYASARLLRWALPGRPRVPERLRNGLHTASAAGLAVAAGFNNTPKLLALGVLGGVLVLPAGWFAALLVPLLLAAGAARAGPVARTVGTGLASLDDRRSAQAALVGAGLTILGAAAGWPLSLTHVVCGAALGAGQARWHEALAVLLAWVVTMPACFAVAAATVQFGLRALASSHTVVL